MNWNTGAQQFTDALASSHPTPGGGAAGAMAGAMGCALVMMAVQTTLKRKNTPAGHRTQLEKSLHRLEPLHAQLKDFIMQDAAAYEAYLTATKLPQDNPSRPQAVQESLWQAASVPAQTAQICTQVMNELASVRPYISNIIIADANSAQHLLTGAVACCVENIRANATYITDATRQAQLQQWINMFSKGTLYEPN